ncbi:MAG: CDP-glucose 4,6-dehydratase [Lachnospiraceae bacterium]|nr:CDP-glucose 4,6-dehydratase [Lachnospiraceae bacterium]
MFDFYKNKSIFITGHTGFKGSWMCRALAEMGAKVTGYSLVPPTVPSLYDEAGIDRDVKSVIGDIRDYDTLNKAFFEAEPEIVIHMAAQPIVRDSYKNPRYTYETNVMGTVNILECVREYNDAHRKAGDGKAIKSFLNVTTDKVYLNREWERGYKEDDELDGYDPYSNSKSCSELVTHAYMRSFFSGVIVRLDNVCTEELSSDGNLFINYIPAISTARAGNVIGGGDFANDRIIPDCVRAVIKGDDIIIRNPLSFRPFQHVLEPVFAYLMISMKQYEDRDFEGYYNVGPDVEDCINAGQMADLFVKFWGEGSKWINKSDNGPHEANFLHLDCTKLKKTFGWAPVWNVEIAVQKTVEWYKVWRDKGDVRAFMTEQIKDFGM